MIFISIYRAGFAVHWQGRVWRLNFTGFDVSAGLSLSIAFDYANDMRNTRSVNY